MRPEKILLLDSNPADSLSGALRKILESSFSQSGTEMRQEVIGGDYTAQGVGELLGIISRFQPDVIFLLPSASLPGQAQTSFQRMRREGMSIPVIVVTEMGEAGEMFRWLELGAADIIAAPLSASEVLARVRQLPEQSAPKEKPTQTLKERFGLRLLVGESNTFLNEVKKIPLLARCSASVMLSGETGTGKELCARAIHYLSQRSHRPFIPVNCGAIPTELVENELFGHERGAYTGAKTPQVGLIQEADGGTLFLDEIDCLSLLSQVKLLRFLQEKEYRPLGSARMCKADVRVIAATNSDSEEAVKAGKLRRDLYYRLNVIPLALPPLRERREDIPLLARHFLAKCSAEFEKQVTGFSPEALQQLIAYDWPGNVRELEHVVMRAVVLSAQTVINDVDIAVSPRTPAAAQESFQGAKNRIIAEFEKSYIERLLLAHHGNISRAAQAAQKNRRAFWELIRKHNIDVKSLKPGVT